MLTLCVKHYMILMTSTRNVASIDSVEVIFDHFLTHRAVSQPIIPSDQKAHQTVIFLDVMASFQLLVDYYQNSKYDNFVY